MHRFIRSLICVIFTMIIFMIPFPPSHYPVDAGHFILNTYIRISLAVGLIVILNIYDYYVICSLAKAVGPRRAGDVV